MTKQEVLDYLKSETERISAMPDNSLFYTQFPINELSKCPVCGTYEGHGFTTFSFLEAVMSCKCGYHYTT